jgi:putative exosortase-associated protein (TIGR04073 family)
MRRSKAALVVFMALLGALMAFQACAWAQDPIHKMGRGVVNVLTGWIELPKQVHLGSQEANPVAGLGWGLVKGISLTVLRAGIGIYETLTFPIPYPKDFASIYEQMELTDYAWE